MKVSRNSWHYRLYVFVRRPWPLFQNVKKKVVIDYVKNDNGYFERVYGTVKGKKLIGDDDSCFIELPVPKNLCRYFWGTVIGIPIFVLELVAAAILVIPVLILIGLAYVFLFFKGGYVSYKRSHPKPYKEQKEKNPSLIGEFAKAKKSKVCPLITMED